MIYDITRGVPKENLDDFTVCLGDSLGLDEEQRTELHARMKMMKFARSKDSSILEMNFNMSEKVVKYTTTSTKTRKFLFWELSPEVTTSEAYKHERVKFGEKDINAIKSAFGRHKALETLRQ